MSILWPEQRPVLYVENDRKEKSRALVEQLMAADYRLFLSRPQLDNLIEITSPDERYD